MYRKFAVIGLGDFGKSMAVSLTEKGAEVIAIDQSMDIVDEIKDKVSYAVRLNSTDEKALKSVGIDKVDVVIVAMGEHFEDTILTSVLLLQMGIKKIVAKASSKIQETILLKLGVHQVVTPEFDMAARLASTLFDEDVLDFMAIGEGYNVMQVKAPDMFIGRTLKEINLRVKYNVNLITIKKTYKGDGYSITQQKISGIPTADTVIEENDVLILLGKDKDIKKIID